MPTTLTNGIQLPDKGSVDWYNSMQSNYNLIDTHLGNTNTHVTAEDKANWNSKQGSLSQAQLDAIAQVATNTSDIATLQSGKANASHTHSSSDITDIGDYATKQYVDNSISGLVDSAPNALDTLNELAAALNDDANFATTVTNALSAKANSADLATVATSGSYTDLSNKPTINDSTITIQKNGSTVDTFTTNGSAKTIDISVPTKTSDLTNDSNFVDTSNSAVASGITSAKVTSYDSHVADTDIHVTTADKNKWNNQAYVFRYSSTALVASSTNSNALLDNTDNLKVGDKVIDSSGVLFSVTAIDTVNSTFTIGSALVDLATDSDVVHKSGNETISGAKTFSSDITLQGTTTPIIKTISNIVQDASAYSGSVSWVIRDKDDLNNILESALYKYSSKTIDWQLKLTGIDNGVSNTKGIRFTLDPVNNVANFIPIGNNSTSLGNSNTKWQSVYATNYYYGSNNVEFSTKFVTTDTAQTITGVKTFANSKVIVGRNTDTGSAIQFVNADVVGDSANGSSGFEVYGSSISDANKIGSITIGEFSNNGGSYATIECNRTVSGVKSSNAIRSLIRSDGSKEFSPSTDNDIKLGHSSFRWSGVYATNYYYGSNNVEFSTKFVTTDTNQTITGNKTFSSINGVEPSSLSMPVAPSSTSYVDISSYITVLDSSAPNTYTPPSNGYITFSVTGNLVQIFHDYGLQGKWSVQAGNANRGFIPVLGGVEVKIYVNASSVDKFWFIPCQGNV